MLIVTEPSREFGRWSEWLLGTPGGTAAMPLDAYRTGAAFFVRFDLPGVKPGSIDVTVEKNMLSVRAERPQAAPGGTEYVVAERPAGIFSRRLSLGGNVDTEHIEADYTDGVLTLRLPVAEHAKPRRIEVGTRPAVPAAHRDETHADTSHADTTQKAPALAQ